MERVEAQVAEFGFTGRVRVVEGGDNRQESVAHALAALPAGPDDIVLVHDAVRPLIDAATIDRTIDAVIEHGAAIVGLPAVDTIKQVRAHRARRRSDVDDSARVHCAGADAAGLSLRAVEKGLCRGDRDWFCGHR